MSLASLTEIDSEAPGIRLDIENPSLDRGVFDFLHLFPASGDRYHLFQDYLGTSDRSEFDGGESNGG
ncbi:MAG: hypothetical protein QNJ70_05185 [Xenococcaceae cyanobacterium MO_207.B15]|nr:hypothetical protein [Xenococcaceae cyanobacterium MO_207.B15]MDJ0744881.1 hypothetical protein [Xenococcaceae cyanobacterium MO_167.B27]